MKTKLRLKIILYLYLFTPLVFFTQNRLVLNDNVFVVIANNAKVVVDNLNTNAVTTTGTGGNIVSEGQQNQLVWIIKNGTGTYTVPWTTKPVVQGGTGTKIPLQMNITSAGSVGGRFNFSTYETSTDMNVAYPTFPTAVTTMGSSAFGGDASLYVVDRFWILDNTSYATVPDATLAFTYDANVNEIAGANLLAEANLVAQRWNSTGPGWESLIFGSTNAVTNVTSGVVAPAATFFPIWILVDLTYPLPVNLLSQSIKNVRCDNFMEWKVTDENFCSHYEINRSYDGLEWEKIGVIKAKNESGELTYTFKDSTFASNGINYYQIKQVDYDGKFVKFDVLAVNSFCNTNLEPILFPNPVTSTLNIKSSQAGELFVYDETGRIVLKAEIKKELNHFDFSNKASGLYTTKIVIEKEEYFNKFIKN